MIQGPKHESGIGIDDWYEASWLAGAQFPKLNTCFSSDWDSGIQNPPTGPSRTDMRFFYSVDHVVCRLFSRVSINSNKCLFSRNVLVPH